MVTVAFWLLAFGAAVAGAGQTPTGRVDNGTLSSGFVGLSLLVSPLAFVLAATLSRRRDWPLWVAAAMGLSVAVGLPLLVFGNPLSAMLSGFAAGAVVSVAYVDGLGWHHRAIAAAVVSLIALAGMSVSFLFVPLAIVGPALPFTAVAVSDMLAQRRVDVDAEPDLDFSSER